MSTNDDELKRKFEEEQMNKEARDNLGPPPSTPPPAPPKEPLPSGPAKETMDDLGPPPSTPPPAPPQEPLTSGPAKETMDDLGPPPSTPPPAPPKEALPSKPEKEMTDEEKRLKEEAFNKAFDKAFEEIMNNLNRRKPSAELEKSAAVRHSAVHEPQSAPETSPERKMTPQPPERESPRKVSREAQRLYDEYSSAKSYPEQKAKINELNQLMEKHKPHTYVGTQAYPEFRGVAVDAFMQSMDGSRLKQEIERKQTLSQPQPEKKPQTPSLFQQAKCLLRISTLDNFQKNARIQGKRLLHIGLDKAASIPGVAKLLKEHGNKVVATTSKETIVEVDKKSKIKQVIAPIKNFLKDATHKFSNRQKP